jgi:dolichyl-phosphate beta-glucosyltransferase
MAKDKLTIVIPAYNEEHRLPPTISKILNWADTTSVFVIELIIVDDGSEDKTCDIVQEFSRKDLRVRLIQESHVGAVHAILKGFQAAKYPLVGNMDADMAVHPRDFEALLPFVNSSSIAQGSRVLRGDLEQIEGSKSLFRRFISECMRIFFKTLFKDQVEDPQIGFRLFHRESIQKIQSTMRLWHDGLKHAEIAIRAFGMGMKVKEIPVRYIHNEDSRCLPKGLIRPSIIILEAFIALISMWIQCSVDYQKGLLKFQVTRGAFLFWPARFF